MINFWKLAYKSVKEQRDQYKEELLQCKSELHHYRAELESYKTNLKQRREERESMISDFQKKLDLISILKEENEKLETQKIAFQRSYKQVYEENKELERENNNLKQSVSEYKGYAESHVANYLELKALEHENKALRLQSDTYFEQWQNEKLRCDNEELKGDD